VAQVLGRGFRQEFHHIPPSSTSPQPSGSPLAYGFAEGVTPPSGGSGELELEFAAIVDALLPKEAHE
jgi:hypothetical protein